jgi:outer membrane receptor protein involved in Fe transport
MQMLAIRGLSSGAITNPTVGITVDDVPFGSSILFGGNVVPDFDPSDLVRVEILRGPQGTLYGASTMGGLIKFVTVDPSTDALRGRVQADVNSVYSGAEPGYAFRGAVNVPLSDTLAIRASALARQDAGYVDNPVLNINGVNEGHVYGGRVSALWRPSDVFTLKVSALYQHTEVDGTNEVDRQTAGFPQTTGLGELQQISVQGCCRDDRQLRAYSAILMARLGNIDVTSVSGYNVSKYFNVLDLTYSLGGFIPGGVTDLTYGTTDKFTQEIRASIPIGQSLEWLVGGLYQHEDTLYNQGFLAVNPVAAPAGSLFNDSVPNKYNEYAAFTDLTIHFTTRFDVQFGGRESHIEQVSEPGFLEGSLQGPTQVIQLFKDTANAFTYLVTPRFKFSSDLMAYARIASGYRPGALNNYNLDPRIPLGSSPDKTQNYEVGVKGEVLDHVLSFDASLYYISWKNIQIELADTNPDPRYSGTSYNTNGSGAKSEGVELSVEARPLTGLAISSWVTYNNAVLTEAPPASSTVYAPAGSRLPYGTRFSGNLSVNQTFPLISGAAGFAGAQLSYVGDRLGTFIPFDPTTPRAYYRAGVTYQAWTANLYANNVADRRGQNGGGAGTYPPYAYYYVQPRTVGLSLTMGF